MLKRGDKVYPQIVKDLSAGELMPVIKGKADLVLSFTPMVLEPMSGFPNYKYKKHYRVKYGKNEFANGHNHI